MKIPDTLPWEYDGFTGLLSSKEGVVIFQTWDMDVKSYPDSDDNGDYIELACNMLPELLDMIDKLASKIEKFHFDSNEDDLYAEELILKADELLNRIKT